MSRTGRVLANLSPTEGQDRALADVSKLSSGNIKFLNGLLEGKGVLLAYKLAGFEGEPHAAYQMKSRLGKYLNALAEQRGLTKADLMNRVGSLADLPLVRINNKTGECEPVHGLTVAEYERILELQLKILQASNTPNERPSSITAIQINRFKEDATEDGQQEGEGPIVDVEAIGETKGH